MVTRALRNRSPNRSPRREHKVVTHLPRDFLISAEAKRSQFTTNQVYFWQNRHNPNYELPTRNSRVSEEDERTAREGFNLYFKPIKTLCRDNVKDKIVKNANDVGLRRSDRQPVCNWLEAYSAMCNLQPMDKWKTYEIMYKKFGPSWHSEYESKIMEKVALKYRPCTKSGRTLKGFVAKTLTLALNKKRHYVEDVKRRQDKAEIDENGRKKRRRNIHELYFDPVEHMAIKNVEEW